MPFQCGKVSHLSYVVYPIEKSLPQFWVPNNKSSSTWTVMLLKEGWHNLQVTLWKGKDTSVAIDSVCLSFRDNYKLLKKTEPQAVPDFLLPYYYIVSVSNSFLPSFLSYIYWILVCAINLSFSINHVSYLFL